MSNEIKEMIPLGEEKCLLDFPTLLRNVYQLKAEYDSRGKLTVKILQYDEFLKTKFVDSCNLSNKEDANYLVVYHEGNVFAYHSDAMESGGGDIFTIDLKPIAIMIEDAYRLGFTDGKKEKECILS